MKKNYNVYYDKSQREFTLESNENEYVGSFNDCDEIGWIICNDDADGNVIISSMDKEYTNYHYVEMLGQLPILAKEYLRAEIDNGYMDEDDTREITLWRVIIDNGQIVIDNGWTCPFTYDEVLN